MNLPVHPESHGARSSGVLDRVARHRGTPWLVLGFSVVTCLVGWYHGDRASRRHAEERFRIQADEAAQSLQGRLAHYEHAVRSAAAFACSVPDVDRARWRDYVRGAGLLSSASGLAAIGYTPRVAHDALAAHRSRLRREGVPDYDVWPASTRPEHYPAAYVEPEPAAGRTVGFDLASDPARSAAVERARDTGSPVLYGDAGLQPAGHDTDVPVFTLMWPVYAAGIPLDGVEQRRTALLGVVHAAFRLPDVLAASLAPPHHALGVSLRQGGPEGTVLHRLPRPDASHAAVVFQAVRPVAVGGQRWSLVVEAGPAAVAPADRWLAALAAAGALLTNGVLTALLFAQRRVRRRAEAFAAEQAVALHRSEGAFLAVAESARVAIVTTDAQGHFTYANAAAEQMLGASRDQLRGVNSAQYIADVDRPRFTEGFRRFLAGDGRIAAGAPTAITGRRQSGEEFPAEISLSWFEAPDDGAYITGVIVDLTDRRRAEETLRLAREQAEQAARSKSDFLAMMSHELRTPMNGVLGMTNLLSSTTLDDEQREYLDMIGRSGNSLLRLIDDILDFSKIEAGRVVLEQMPCDVGVITREVITLLRVQAHTKGLRLDSHVAAGTPTALITDPGRLRQVLFNLVGNAIKFTEAGAVHVTVGCDRVEAGRATLRVTVSDTGIGIHRGIAAAALREVHAGRCVDHPPLRRHGTGARHLEGARREPRWRHRRVERGGRGIAVLVHARGPGVGHGVVEQRGDPERGPRRGGVRSVCAAWPAHPRGGGQPGQPARGRADAREARVRGGCRHRWQGSGPDGAGHPLRGHPDGLPHAGRRWL